MQLATQIKCNVSIHSFFSLHLVSENTFIIHNLLNEDERKRGIRNQNALYPLRFKFCIKNINPCQLSIYENALNINLMYFICVDRRLACLSVI